MTDKIKAVLIDDSEQALHLLNLMLKEFAPEIEVLATAKNVDEGLEAIAHYQPDVIFLDIEMPEKSGLQLAEELFNQKIKCEVVFTTAYNQYAIKAFRLSAIDYLLKPIEEDQLLQAVDKLVEKLKSGQNNLEILAKNLTSNEQKILSIPVLNGYEYIPLDTIEYLEAEGSYTYIHSIDTKHKIASKNLKYFEQALEGQSNFLRVHRSYIINLDNIHSFSKANRGIITMKNGKEIDLARDRRKTFFDKMK